jgi:hypothetical protein
MKRLIGTFLLLGLLLGSPLRAFISPDPEGHVASMDLYSYCNGDPVNQYDADGRIGKGAATGVALGGFGQYENTTQQIAGLVGQVGSYFIPGMQGYSAARDITFSGYSASKAAYDIGENGLNLKNGSELVLSATGLIPGVGGVGSAVRGESSAVFQELRQTISLGAENRTAFTGGRTLKQGDFDAAESLYNTIRQTDDVTVIAGNSGLPQFQVQRVKDHLFNNAHQLDDGMRLFDADPMIGNAWQRMQSGTHTPADIQLFKHELFEAKFEGIFKQNYRTSHDAANRAGRLSGLE